jgi:hypothetical protein
MKHTRAQFEILGLAIIMVIVIFAILLTLILMPKTNQNSLQSDVVDSTLASNLLNVIWKTTLDCKDINLESLLVDCAIGANSKEYCAKYAAYDGLPCDLSQKIIKEATLAKTLSVWKRNYTFRADSGTKNLFNITNTLTSKGTAACLPRVYTSRFKSFTSESNQVRYALDPYNYVDVSISLYICR